MILMRFLRLGGWYLSVLNVERTHAAKRCHLGQRAEALSADGRKVPVFGGRVGVRRRCHCSPSVYIIRLRGSAWAVILAGASPSSQSCGLAHVWGGGWEGPLTATPPCPPAPRRSKSPGKGSEEQAEQRKRDSESRLKMTAVRHKNFVTFSLLFPGFSRVSKCSAPHLTSNRKEATTS